MVSMPIVVGADGSEQSSRAVEWAAREAVRRKAPLRIVSVSVMPSRMRPRNANPATVADILHKISARNLAAALTRAREVAPGLLIDTDLVAGPPAQTLTACGSGASMLVVGARGEGGFTAMVLGSVSRYVALHAPCPVVVAHEDSVAVHREVVAGVGDPAESADSLGFAFEEASMRGARLRAVHALARYPASSGWDDEDLKLAGWLHAAPGLDADGEAGEPPDESAVAAELGQVLAGWQEKYPEVRVGLDVIRGHAGRVLASYSARADLVVIGRHGNRESIAGVGSIQHPVLNHAHGPIAIVPSTH
jgi:nucleotide-binding universal stress UspA family protein